MATAGAMATVDPAPAAAAGAAAAAAPAPRRPIPDFIEDFRGWGHGHNALYVLSLGLGGHAKSMALHKYLEDHCSEYKYVLIYAFGDDMIGRSKGYRTYNVIRTIETLFNRGSRCSTHGGIVITFNSNNNLPTVSPLDSEYPGMLETYVDFNFQRDITFKYYNDKVYTYTPAFETQDVMSFFPRIRDSMRSFLENVPNGHVMIDNNVFIRGSDYYKNLNYEYMPWIPQMLDSFGHDDRIFQLRKSSIPRVDDRISVNTAIEKEPAEKVPFFSRDAIFRVNTAFEHLPNYIIHKYPSVLDPFPSNLYTFLYSLPLEHRNMYARHIYNCLKVNGRIDRLPKFGDGSDCGIDGTTATGNSNTKSKAGASAGGTRRRRKTHRRRKSSRKVRV
jgi:hypothetical protein